MLGDRERDPRCHDPLDERVVGRVQKQDEIPGGWVISVPRRS
jgi:hypothetical protein